MKKIYTLILLLMIVLGNISYSGTWQDSVSKRARERGISYAEAEKQLNKEINDALKFYATEYKKEKTAIKGPNPSVYVPYDIISYINSAQNSFINENNEKVYVFSNNADTFFQNMGKELFGVSFQKISGVMSNLHITKKEYAAIYDSESILLAYTVYDSNNDSLLFLFNFEYKKANDGGYYVMCKEALIEFSDGTILRDEEAMKKFKS